jgi:hypothetical protein
MYALFPIREERLEQRAGTLSGGEQQMLAIARALMARPKLLLLDEPSLGLAPLYIKKIFQTIRELNQDHGMTILLIEQNAHHALRAAHRGYVMQHGRITMTGSGRDLLASAEVRAAQMEGGQRWKNENAINHNGHNGHRNSLIKQTSHSPAVGFSLVLVVPVVLVVVRSSQNTHASIRPSPLAAFVVLGIGCWRFPSARSWRGWLRPTRCRRWPSPRHAGHRCADRTPFAVASRRVLLAITQRQILPRAGRRLSLALHFAPGSAPEYPVASTA